MSGRVAADALFDAVTGGDLSRLAALLATDPALAAARNAAGRSALTLAIYRRQPAVADLLIARGAPVDLFAAAALGDVARIDTLLAADPELVNRHSPDGWTALALAAHFGQAEAARRLLARGADPALTAANALANTPLHAAVAGNQFALVALLLEQGDRLDVDARDANGYTPLGLAAHAGLLPLVELLLAGGADASIPNDQGQTPLAVAEARGHDEVAGRLRVATA